MILRIPFDRLPNDDAARDRMLTDYFCERFATSRRDGDAWVLDVRPPPTADFYVDPRLYEGLSWWDPAMTVTDIPTARREVDGTWLSLNDAWTAHAWSERCWAEGNLPLVVLHVDDHDDLMSPRLGKEPNGSFRDLVTGQPVDLSDSSSVERAVVSGAIGQGSFIAPFLHLGRAVHVRHLSQSRYLGQRKGSHSLEASLVSDMVLDDGAIRPGVTLKRDGDGPSTYALAQRLEVWLADLPLGELVLHVDFDYFNNRYDGDSDWSTREVIHDPSSSVVVQRVTEVMEAVRQLDRPLVAVSGALSPGFFPAEMWQASVQTFLHLAQRLRRA